MCMYVCICVHECISMNVYMHIFMCAYVCMHPCMCVYTYMFHVLFTHSDHISTNIPYEHFITGEKDIGIETQSGRRWLI